MCFLCVHKTATINTHTKQHNQYPHKTATNTHTYQHHHLRDVFISKSQLYVSRQLEIIAEQTAQAINLQISKAGLNMPNHNTMRSRLDALAPLLEVMEALNSQALVPIRLKYSSLMQKLLNKVVVWGGGVVGWGRGVGGGHSIGCAYTHGFALHMSLHPHMFLHMITTTTHVLSLSLSHTHTHTHTHPHTHTHMFTTPHSPPPSPTPTPTPLQQ